MRENETPPPGSIPERDRDSSSVGSTSSATNPPGTRRRGAPRKVSGVSVEAQARAMLKANDRKKRRDRAQKVLDETASTLTDDEIRELLRPDEEDVVALKEMAKSARSGRKMPRNAMAALGALKLMFEHTVTKPKVETGLDGAVTVVVNKVASAAAGYQMPADETSGTREQN